MAARRLEVVALAVLLVTAGCSGFAPVGDDDTGPTSSLTPVSVPEEDGREELAPGLTADGVQNPEALADAHAARLENRSYRLVINRTVRDWNESLREQLLLNLSLSTDRSYLVDTATAGPEAPVFLGRPPAEATFWSNGSVYTRRLSRDGGPTYTAFQPSEGAGTWQYWARTAPFGGQQSSPRGFISRTFAAVPTRTADRQVRENGTTYRLEGARAVGPLGEVDDPRAVTLRARVTDAGLVRSVSLSYTGTIGGELVRAHWTVRYEDIGTTTVEQPSWTERALGQD